MTDMNLVTDILGKLKSCQHDLKNLASDAENNRDKQKFKKIQQSIRQCEDILEGSINNEIEIQSRLSDPLKNISSMPVYPKNQSAKKDNGIKIPDLD